MKIVVLCGGVSTEREISIISGTGVCKALRSKGHNAILLDAFFGDPNVNLMDAFPDDYDVDEAAGLIREYDVELESALSNPNRGYFGVNVTKLCKMSDIVFLALHGENGENGKLQASFDLKKIRYTGTGYLGSAVSMNKWVSKTLLRAAGVPVPDGYFMKKGEEIPEPHERGLSYPVVVKVCCGGSSVGVYIANDTDSYISAVDKAFQLEDEVLVETYISGREFSVGLIGGEALPVIEIAPVTGFYDYKNKYTSGAAVETCPADIPGDATRLMKSFAEKGYAALMLEAYGRIDFLMDEGGSVYCLEANTLPGMTPTSLLPQEAASLGIDYPSLCERLVQVSLEKYGKKI